MSSRRRAFQHGQWAPPGFNYPILDKPRPTRRVGKRMAYALMAHYGFGTVPDIDVLDVDAELDDGTQQSLEGLTALRALAIAAQELMANTRTSVVTGALMEDLSMPRHRDRDAELSSQPGLVASIKPVTDPTAPLISGASSIAHLMDGACGRVPKAPDGARMTPLSPPKSSGWAVPSRAKVFGWIPSRPSWATSEA